MVFYFWNPQWTNSSWFQRPLVSVDRNQVSLPSWKDKTTFVSRNNYVVLIERLVNGLIVFWVSECSSPLWARKINFQSKTLSTVLNPNPIKKHFVYPDYFSFCTRPREIEGNENNNLGWQKFSKKKIFTLFFRVKKRSRWEKTLERMLRFWPGLNSTLYEGMCYYFIHSFRLIEVILNNDNAQYLYIAHLKLH